MERLNHLLATLLEGEEGFTFQVHKGNKFFNLAIKGDKDFYIHNEDLNRLCEIAQPLANKIQPSQAPTEDDEDLL